MVKYVKLKQFMLEKDIDRNDIAELLGIGVNLVSSKLNKDNIDFTLPQIKKICSTYKISADTYFINV